MKNVFNKNLIVGIQEYCETQIANLREYESKCGQPNMFTMLYYINDIRALCTIAQLSLPDKVEVMILTDDVFMKKDVTTLCNTYVDISYHIDNGYEGK